MKAFNLDFYSSYNQFFIFDKNISFDSTEEMWTDQAFLDRLSMLPGRLSVGTACYGTVRAELRLLDNPSNKNDFNDYDHVVEGSINIKSGIIQIIACMANEPELEISVDPGVYRIRIYSSNLGSVIGDEGDDFYLLEIWKQNFTDRLVLKRMKGSNGN
ncbi:MAG: hypothetical protein HOP10_07175 [Chitinophagaceae bacterium]|nr:hypothetical protein [Chitinophagaceae bacterium]